jgi:methionine-rich copper-binding protein CopC
MKEVFRVFDIVIEDCPAHLSLTQAVWAAHNHLQTIDGASVEWSPSTPSTIRLRFEEHVSAHNVMLDIIDELSSMGYK